MIKAVIFDYDGVLFDSVPVLHDAYRRACGALGFEVPDYQAFVAEHSINAPVVRTYSEYCEGLDEEAILQEVRGKIGDITEKAELFKGATETLQKLKEENRLLGMVSGSPRDPVEKVLKAASVYDLFDDFALEVSPRKGMKKSTYITKIYQDFGLLPEEVAYLGDFELDMKEAREAGVLAVGVTGEIEQERRVTKLGSAGADHLITHITELPELLQSLEETEGNRNCNEAW